MSYYPSATSLLRNRPFGMWYAELVEVPMPTSIASLLSDRGRQFTSEEYRYEFETFSDYYPFGMAMPGRQFNSEDYRYGFNGMEKDDEVKGAGNSIDFGARVYDSRLGRWLSLDPAADVYAGKSLYGYVSNSPIVFIDVEGAFQIRITDDAKKKYNLTDDDVVRFNEVLAGIQNYLQSEVGRGTLAVLSRHTGYTKDQILADAEFGTGPTIVLAFDDQSQFMGANVNRLDAKANEIHFDASIIKNFEEMEFGSEDEKAAYYIEALTLVLHEYTHLGDRRKNDGNITGQGESNDIILNYPLENGVQGVPSGRDQYGKNLDHRGKDTELSITNRSDGCVGLKIEEDGSLNFSLTGKNSAYKLKKSMEGDFEKTYDAIKKK